MVYTSFATTLPRCPRVVLSTWLSKVTSTRRISTSNLNSAALRVRCANNLELFSGSSTVWRRHGSTSAAKAQRSVRHEWNEVQEQAEEELATREKDTKHEHLEGSSRRLKSNLRALLRDIAQPVAVVTSFMPSSPTGLSNQTGENHPHNGSIYHGATLSSFTSIAMDPYPLVSFALRIPSRMASALTSLSKSSSSPSSLHMVINLLSSSQASTALTFSRPDLYPTPFLVSSSSSSASGRTEAIPYTLSQDGLPILNDIIGALSCQLVGGPIPLHDLDYLSSREKVSPPSPSVHALRAGEVASELFIARVVRVEEMKREKLGEEDERTLQPLIYHRRGYTSCKTNS